MSSGERDPFTRAEERRLREEARAGEASACPRCGHSFATQEVPPRKGVSYVRRRLWLVCKGCARSVIMELPKR